MQADRDVMAPSYGELLAQLQRIRQALATLEVECDRLTEGRIRCEVQLRRITTVHRALEPFDS
jgi:hypothetical protein